MAAIAVRLATNIDGWMDSGELFWLAQQAAVSAKTLEVGVWKGRSTRTMGINTTGQVLGVDPWRPYSELDATDEIYAEAMRNTADLPNVELFRGTLETLPREQFNFIFIDGCHEHAAVKQDIIVAMSLLAPGGKLAGHDYPQVRRAVHEIFPRVDLINSIWHITPNAQQVAWAQSTATQPGALRCFDEAVRILGHPETLLDVGCGDGFLVRAATAKGIRAGGIDLYYDGTDLTKFWDGGLFDWVICWEVAEHLPPESAEVLVRTISNACFKYVLFSAAHVGQGGSGHLNERPSQYWIDLFARQGLFVDEARSVQLSERFLKVSPQEWWYGQNIMLMERR